NTNMEMSCMADTIENHKTVATQFIEAFNTDDWDTVRNVVSPNYVYHHPIGGTVQAGPEGMVAAWSSFKSSLPDSWHPIPVMITDRDYLAVLLPTYGNFTGEPYHNIPSNGKWLEYGMVNIVRFENGLIAENWLGMDPLTEMQQMGAAPLIPPRQLTSIEEDNIKSFQQTINTTGQKYDNITAFRNVVVALGPPQSKKDTTKRRVEIYRLVNESLKLVKSYEFTINPPYSGDPSVDTELSRDIVKGFIKDILNGHNLDAIAKVVTSDILIHPTAMPCEASYYGYNGVSNWLETQWKAFPDLTISDYFTVAHGDIVATHWTARGISKGKFLILPPSGNIVDYTGSSMYRIENGQIAEIWETRNTLAIMGQLNPDMNKDNHSH
ncbi:ester cyclase, partial [Candidatus Bathyarchaeota archaeon]|nr:ester cyclase [Candidatus Bathyarchaeota archaeon]